jgi:hypothetical protein
MMLLGASQVPINKTGFVVNIFALIANHTPQNGASALRWCTKSVPERDHAK